MSFNPKEYQRAYYLKNKEKAAKVNKAWYWAHREQALKNAKDYLFKHKEKKYANQNQRRRKYRLELIKKLGGKCKRCGFSDWRALQIDHIKGGGCRDKELHQGWRGDQIILNNKTGKYQLLCANCNWIKRYENNETNKRLVF
jgi:hypothetical protein